MLDEIALEAALAVQQQQHGGLLPWQNEARIKAQRVRRDGYSDYGAYVFNFGPLLLGAPLVRLVKFDSDSSFEWVSTSGAAVFNFGAGNANAPLALSNGPPIEAQFIDDAGRGFSNVPTPISALAGYCGPNLDALAPNLQGAFVHILPVPRVFRPGSELRLALNNVGSEFYAVSTQICLHGHKIFGTGKLPRYNTWRGRDGELYGEDWFSYTFFWPAITPPSLMAQTVTIEADNDFEWIATSCTDATLFSVYVGFPATFNLVESASGRSFFNQPVQALNLAGTGTNMAVLPQSHIFEGRSQVTATYNNQFITGQEGPVYLTLEGRRIFRVGGANAS